MYFWRPHLKLFSAGQNFNGKDRTDYIKSTSPAVTHGTQPQTITTTLLFIHSKPPSPVHVLLQFRRPDHQSHLPSRPFKLVKYLLKTAPISKQSRTQQTVHSLASTNRTGVTRPQTQALGRATTKGIPKGVAAAKEAGDKISQRYQREAN